MARCSSCENFEGSNNPSVMGFCEMRQIPVMPGRCADDCPYYSEEITFDDDDDNDW